MTLSADDKKALSDVRFVKASRFLDDAKANLAENSASYAIDRGALSCL